MLDTVYLTGICLKRRPLILCGNWTWNNKTVQISVWLPEYACLIPFPVVHVLFLSWKNNNVLLCYKYSLKGGYHDLLNGHFVPWLCMTKKTTNQTYWSMSHSPYNNDYWVIVWYDFFPLHKFIRVERGT